MHITTLTSPFLLRKYMTEDETLTALVGNNIFPINADESTTGNFVTTTRTNYDNGEADANHVETTTVEVELCSQDYDTAVLKMLDALRIICIKMRNDGNRVKITNVDEYKYAHVEGGQTWNAERVTIEMKNISTEIELDED